MHINLLTKDLSLNELSWIQKCLNRTKPQHKDNSISSTLKYCLLSKDLN
jgi:hypothetical protein